MAEDTKPKLATSFRDLIKSSGVINDNFLSNQSFSVKTEAKAGDVTLKTSVLSGDKPVAGSFEPKYELKAEGLVFEGKVNTEHTFNGKVTAKNFFLDGLNVSLSGDRSTTAKKDDKKEEVIETLNTGTLGLQFNNEMFHVVADLKVPIAEDAAKKTNVTVSATVHPIEQVTGGLSLSYTLDGELSGEGKVAGGTDDVEVSLQGKYGKDLFVGINFWNKFNEQLTWAVAAGIPINDEKATDPKSNSYNLAGEYKFDDFSTGKAKFTINTPGQANHNEFRAALGIQQKVNANTTVTVGADFNLNSALCLDWQTGKPTSCGIQLSLK